MFQENFKGVSRVSQGKKEEFPILDTFMNNIYEFDFSTSTNGFHPVGNLSNIQPPLGRE